MKSDFAKLALAAAKEMQGEIRDIVRPPSEIAPSPSQPVLPFTLFKRCQRGYIQKVVHQINRTYSETCYDACAVMIRRLVETLIIEAFEQRKIDSKVKNQSGDFFQLKDLIDATLNESTWNLTRNSKSGLKNLKNIGDLSAHSRRFNAHREDIDNVSGDLRVVVQELLSLANLG